VLNVSYELHAGSPSGMTLLKYNVLPTPHSHLLEFRNGTETPNLIVGQSMQPKNAGQNFGGNSAVNVQWVKSKTGNEQELAQGLGNEGAIEVAYDAVDPMYHLSHPNSTDLMRPHGAAYPEWLKDPTLPFSPDVAAPPQQKYNRPGEVEQQPQPCKPEEEKK
jgi:hypothetical protein